MKSRVLFLLLLVAISYTVVGCGNEDPGTPTIAPPKEGSTPGTPGPNKGGVAPPGV